MSKSSRPRETTARKPGRSWAIPVAGVLGVGLVALVVIGLIQGQGSPDAAGQDAAGQDAGQATQGQATEAPDFSFAERHDPADVLTTGEADAPVTLIVFSDYQCPYCAQWNHNTLPELMPHVEAGDLRIEWRDLNVFGPESERAAHASYAAAMQGAYLDYHEALFANGEKRSEADLSADALVNLADDLGLDTEQFALDMDSPTTASEVAANGQLAMDLGIYSTPIFLLAGEPIIGAQPTSVFTDAFNAALANAQLEPQQER